ncbi:kinase-like domain-containing protein [Gigaspora rosea]|uniref:Kinase-like domain-containing protein n=1 Tax=Gigaspora rosea TaxID=44941 RepID=A0A397VZL6_9GLOM|nr:kinase-like domain-containing protein [Gigaspora rosea]
MGSLRKNLCTIAQMRWEKKLELISYIALDLQLIHSHNIIHRDLHSGNIFQDDLHNAYIGDLGFAIAINRTLEKESNEIYGALPYIAPEILQRKSFTKASDIYSFGIIMWEISSDDIAFSKYEGNEESLFIEICNGLRPNILKGTATCYAELLKKCWDKDPDKRPSALEIYETIKNWKNNTEILSEFIKSDNEMVIENNQSDVIIDNNSVYSSKLISLINQKLNNCDISDNNIDIEKVIMEMDAEKVKMDFDTIKVEIDVDAENVIVDDGKYIKVNNSKKRKIS